MTSTQYTGTTYATWCACPGTEVYDTARPTRNDRANGSNRCGRIHLSRLAEIDGKQQSTTRLDADQSNRLAELRCHSNEPIPCEAIKANHLEPGAP